MEDGGFRGRGGGSRGRGGRGRGGGNRGGISWIKKEEPKFIRQFKERIAYKEQASVDTKKKRVDDKDLNIEKEEDLPQVIQLKSGDLDETEYVKMKNKEEIENSASSFGKIVFKRPKKANDTVEETKEIKTSELNSIFNLDENGEEKVKEDIEDETQDEEESPIPKKNHLDDEDDKNQQYGLQQPPTKKRFIDGPTSKTTSISAAKVLAREAKAGNKKLLSFYDEEEEEIEEYSREDFKEKMEKEARQKAEESD